MSVFKISIISRAGRQYDNDNDNNNIYYEITISYRRDGRLSSRVRSVGGVRAELARRLADAERGACVDKTAFCRPNGKTSERKSGGKNAAAADASRRRLRTRRRARHAAGGGGYGRNNNITRAGSPLSLLPSVSCLVAQ